jgi:hypothetical protein
LLRADHRKVEDLFKKFRKAKAPSQKQQLAREICIEHTVHLRIEEEIFYPACRDVIEDADLDESYVEHDGAKVLIAEIEESGTDAAFFDAKVTVLCEQISHHVEEEERRTEGLFAAAKAAGLDMANLGVEMAARKQELLEEIRAEGLPVPETRTFIGRGLPKGAPVEAPRQP